jgi:hypothetical protein
MERAEVCARALRKRENAKGRGQRTERQRDRETERQREERVRNVALNREICV